MAENCDFLAFPLTLEVLGHKKNITHEGRGGIHPNNLKSPAVKGASCNMLLDINPKTTILCGVNAFY